MRYFERAALFAEACQEFGFMPMEDERNGILEVTLNRKLFILETHDKVKVTIYRQNRADLKMSSVYVSTPRVLKLLTSMVLFDTIHY
mgnify:CR=1 FL=1